MNNDPLDDHLDVFLLLSQWRWSSNTHYLDNTKWIPCFKYFQIVLSSFTPLTQVYTLVWQEVVQNQSLPQISKQWEMRKDKALPLGESRRQLESHSRLKPRQLLVICCSSASDVRVTMVTVGGSRLCMHRLFPNLGSQALTLSCG